MTLFQTSYESLLKL